MDKALFWPFLTPNWGHIFFRKIGYTSRSPPPHWDSSKHVKAHQSIRVEHVKARHNTSKNVQNTSITSKHVEQSKHIKACQSMSKPVSMSITSKHAKVRRACQSMSEHIEHIKTRKHVMSKHDKARSARETCPTCFDETHSGGTYLIKVGTPKIRGYPQGYFEAYICIRVRIGVPCPVV